MLRLILIAATSAFAALDPSIRNFDGGDGYPLPAKLSGTGLYSDIAMRTRKITDGVYPYSINSPLWSDGASKERFVSPPPGTHIVPTDTDSYAYPEHTVFVKNFWVDTVYGDDESAILVETRFLVRHAGGSPDDNPWHGISYHWLRDQSDADLVSQDLGENAVINVRMNGVLRGKRWTWPAKRQCNTCHFNRGILGFITPQLNLMTGGDFPVSQLPTLVALGVLSANPVTGTEVFHWHGINDKSATLEERARSYFASNCSQCHGNGPAGTSPGDHVFDYFHPEVSIDQGPTGANGAYVGKLTHQGGADFPQFVYKGWPESSYVLKRMLTRQDFSFYPTEQMPTLATFQPDSAGLNLLKDWICSLRARPATECRLPNVQPDASYWDDPAAALHDPRSGPRGKVPLRAFLRQGILRVTVTPGSPLPTLYEPGGRRLRLQAEGPGVYRVLSPLRRGIYFLKTADGFAALENLE